ncbi:MAG: T9SS type A sorting domain-containing protein [Bacteroidales bacterium]
MKTKIYLLIVITISCLNLLAQEFNTILDTFLLQEVCKQTNMSGAPNRTLSYEIMFKTSTIDTCDIQFKLEPYFLDTIRAKYKGNNVFEIPQHKFINFDSSNLYIHGNINLKKDSIYLQYRTGGSMGLFDCDCKGVRKNVVITIGEKKDKPPFIQVISDNSKEKLYFKVNSEQLHNEKFKLFVYNSNGVIVQSKSLNLQDLQINTRDFPIGFYIIKISNKSICYSFRYIKN